MNWLRDHDDKDQSARRAQPFDAGREQQTKMTAMDTRASPGSAKSVKGGAEEWKEPSPSRPRVHRSTGPRHASRNNQAS